MGITRIKNEKEEEEEEEEVKKRTDDKDKLFLKIIELLWRNIQNRKAKKHFEENLICWKIEWTYKKNGILTIELESFTNIFHDINSWY